MTRLPATHGISKYAGHTVPCRCNRYNSKESTPQQSHVSMPVKILVIQVPNCLLTI